MTVCVCGNARGNTRVTQHRTTPGHCSCSVLLPPVQHTRLSTTHVFHTHTRVCVRQVATPHTRVARPVPNRSYLRPDVGLDDPLLARTLPPTLGDGAAADGINGGSPVSTAAVPAGGVADDTAAAAAAAEGADVDGPVARGRLVDAAAAGAAVTAPTPMTPPPPAGPTSWCELPAFGLTTWGIQPHTHTHSRSLRRKQRCAAGRHNTGVTDRWYIHSSSSTVTGGCWRTCNTPTFGARPNTSL